MLAAIAMLAAGCGTQTLELDEVQSELRREVAAQVGAGVKSVTCPDEVEARKGATFSCVATGADGSTARIQARQTGDDGEISWSNASLVSTGSVEQELERQFADQLETRVEVTCPDLIEGREGRRIACQMSDGGEIAQTVRLRMVKEEEGLRLVTE